MIFIEAEKKNAFYASCSARELTREYHLRKFTTFDDQSALWRRQQALRGSLLKNQNPPYKKRRREGERETAGRRASEHGEKIERKLKRPGSSGPVSFQRKDIRNVGLGFEGGEEKVLKKGGGLGKISVRRKNRPST